MISLAKTCNSVDPPFKDVLLKFLWHQTHTGVCNRLNTQFTVVGVASTTAAEGRHSFFKIISPYLGILLSCFDHFTLLNVCGKGVMLSHLCSNFTCLLL